MSNSTKESGRHIESVLKAFEVLECLEAGSWKSLKELSEITAMNKSRIMRLCGTMASKGYIQQDPNTGHYTIGYKVLPLARAYKRQNPIVTYARPILKELVQLTGASASISKTVGTKRIGLAWEEGTHPVRYSMNSEGMLMPLTAGAAGKLLLAYSTEDFIDQILKSEEFSIQLTKSTITDPDLMRGELRSIRKQAYAISLAERVIEGAALAVPVTDFSGQVCAALALVSTVHRFSNERYLEHLPLLKEKAAALSSMMGAPENE